jgi:hypothetical protein
MTSLDGIVLQRASKRRKTVDLLGFEQLGFLSLAAPLDLQ